jgi:hypothetical protein
MRGGGGREKRWGRRRARCGRTGEGSCSSQAWQGAIQALASLQERGSKTRTWTLYEEHSRLLMKMAQLGGHARKRAKQIGCKVGLQDGSRREGSTVNGQQAHVLQLLPSEFHSCAITSRERRSV